MHVSRSTLRRLTRLALTGVLAAATTAAFAQQGPQDHHDDNKNNGHPPQAQNNNNRGPQQNNNHPAPQAQNNNRPGPQQNNYRFQQNDRGRFQSHYQNDANRWRNNPRRPHFSAGQAIPRNYAIQAVPYSYYQGAPPPPPGYRYGYYDGYVVAYNPTTRIIADVLDLLTGN